MRDGDHEIIPMQFNTTGPENLLDPEAFRKWLTHIEGVARERFVRLGRISAPVLFLLVMKHPKTGIELAAPGVISFMGDWPDNTPEQKNLYTDAARTMLARFDGVGAVWLAECWLAKSEAPGDDGLSKVRNIDEAYSKGDQRHECLYLAAEHVRIPGANVRVAMIRRDPKGGDPELEDFTTFSAGTNTKIQGRFCDLLNRKRWS